MNTLTAMRYLLALQEHQHFGRAAQASHITQPALSNAIKTLESQLGVVIVKRGRSFAGFTAEGNKVLVRAQRMLREYEQLSDELRMQTDEPVGQLRLGAVPTAIPVAVRLASSLQALHPGIQTTVLSCSSDELEHGLMDLKLDLALGYEERASQAMPKLSLIAQYEEAYFLLKKRSAGDQLNGNTAPAVTWREVSAQPLCLLAPPMHNRVIIDAVFKKLAVQVKPAMETNSVLALAISVQAGRVQAIVPGAMASALIDPQAHELAGGLVAHPLIKPQLRTPMVLMHLTQSSGSAALDAALRFAQSAEWQAQLARHTGLLQA